MEQNGTWGHSSRKKELECKMEILQHEIILHNRTDTTVEGEKHLKSQFEDRYAQEEILWRQKSRVQWLKEGEKTTSFFHRSMI